PSAPAPAYAGPATAIAPDAAARAITPFRVTRLIASLPSRRRRGHSPAPGRTRTHHRSRGASVSHSPSPRPGAPARDPPAQAPSALRPAGPPASPRRPPVRPTGGAREARLG